MKKLLFFLLVLLPSLVFSQRVTITMERDGGVYKVPCEINGARMKFVFDTGASMISLSANMAEYLLENDYLNEDDFVGTQDFRDANGNITKKLVANIRDLSIAGLHVHNVKASISMKQNVPLLLGISAIEKLGKVTINGNTIIIDNDKNLYSKNEQNIAFLGLKQFSYYDDCYEIMANRFGEDNLYDSVINGKISAISVSDAYFMDYYFSEINLIFDDDILQAVKCIMNFEVNESKEAYAFFEEIYKLLHKKYTASSSSSGYNPYTKSTDKDYYLGYIERKDNTLFPISLLIRLVENTISSRSSSIYKTKNYEVELTYWPKYYNNLLLKYPSESEY